MMDGYALGSGVLRETFRIGVANIATALTMVSNVNAALVAAKSGNVMMTIAGDPWESRISVEVISIRTDASAADRAAATAAAERLAHVRSWFQAETESVAPRPVDHTRSVGASWSAY